MTPWRAVVIVSSVLVPLGEGARYDMVHELLEQESSSSGPRAAEASGESSAQSDALHLDVSNKDCRIHPTSDDLGLWLKNAATLEEQSVECTDFGKYFGWYGRRQCPESIRNVSQTYEMENQMANGGKSGAQVVITPKYVVKVINVKEAELMTKFLQMHTGGEGSLILPKGRTRRDFDRSTTTGTPSTTTADLSLQLTDKPDPNLTFIVPVCRWVLVHKPDSKHHPSHETGVPERSVDKKDLIMIIMPNVMLQGARHNSDPPQHGVSGGRPTYDDYYWGRMTFDLKGNYLQDKRFAEWKKSTWKDQNFHRLFPDGVEISKARLKGQDVASDGAVFLEALRKDTMNMLQHGLMDYSLLVDMVDLCPDKIEVKATQWQQGMEVTLSGFTQEQQWLNDERGVLENLDMEAGTGRVKLIDSLVRVPADGLEVRTFQKGVRVKLKRIRGNQDPFTALDPDPESGFVLVTRPTLFNGQEGILQEQDMETGLWRVKLNGGYIISLPADNLQAVVTNIVDSAYFEVQHGLPPDYLRMGGLPVFESFDSQKIIRRLKPGVTVYPLGPPITEHSLGDDWMQPVSPSGVVMSKFLIWKADPLQASTGRCADFTYQYACAGDRQDGEDTGVEIIDAEIKMATNAQDRCLAHCESVSAKCCEFKLRPAGGICIARWYRIEGVRLQKTLLPSTPPSWASLCAWQVTRSQVMSLGIGVKVNLKKFTKANGLRNGREGVVESLYSEGWPGGVWLVKLPGRVVTVPFDNLQVARRDSRGEDPFLPDPRFALGTFRRRTDKTQGKRPVYVNENWEFVYYHNESQRWHIGSDNTRVDSGISTPSRAKMAAQCPHDEPVWWGANEGFGENPERVMRLFSVTAITDRDKDSDKNIDMTVEQNIVVKNENKPLLWVEADGFRWVMSIGIIDIFMRGKDRGLGNTMGTAVTFATCKPSDIDPIKSKEYRVRFMRMFGYKDPQYHRLVFQGIDMPRKRYCGSCLGHSHTTYFRTQYQKEKHGYGECEWGD